MLPPDDCGFAGHLAGSSVTRRSAQSGARTISRLGSANSSPRQVDLEPTRADMWLTGHRSCNAVSV